MIDVTTGAGDSQTSQTGLWEELVEVEDVAFRRNEYCMQGSVGNYYMCSSHQNSHGSKKSNHWAKASDENEKSIKNKTASHSFDKHLISICKCLYIWVKCKGDEMLPAKMKDYKLPLHDAVKRNNGKKEEPIFQK